MKSRRVDAISLHGTDLKLSARLSWSMTKFAISAALERLSMRLVQVIYFSLIVRMGVDVYATHNIAGNSRHSTGCCDSPTSYRLEPSL